jgi:hypothetical protein
MPKAYAANMRSRVIARVESGTSRRETAEHCEGRCAASAAGREHLAVGGAYGVFCWL